jgi:hypothetical protein
LTRWRSIDAPPTPRRPSVIGWDAFNGNGNSEPNCLDPAYPSKTAFRFPPRATSLGVFYCPAAASPRAPSQRTTVNRSGTGTQAPRFIPGHGVLRSRRRRPRH